MISFQHASQSRAGRLAVLATAGILLAVAGCGGSDESDRSLDARGASGQGTLSGQTAVSNLVMIAVDTVRWDTWWIPERTGSYDRFSEWAQSSQVLSRSVSAAPWTVPSVATVLTGLYPSQHGAGLFDSAVANLDKEIPSALNAGVPTLAEILGSVGLRTTAVSAHPWFDANYGLERGFETLRLKSGAAAVTQQGLEWLDEHLAADAGPYFLYLHYMDVHDPHLNLTEAREHVANMSAQQRALLEATAPASACRNPDGTMCVRYLRYALATLFMRESIAHLLNELRARGVLDDSLVVLYSDHGEEFHDHYEIGESRAVDPRGFYGFGHGNSLYQEQLHVPLMIWHPMLEGLDMPKPVSLVDIVPSGLDWMGISPPEQVDYPGESFAGLIEKVRPVAFSWSDDSRRFPGSSDRRLFASGIAYGPEQMAVIAEGFKLIWHEADNVREFYNLSEDPLEKEQLPGAAVAVADELDAELGDYFDWFSSQDYLPPSLSDEVVERLKGVGYLQGVESSEAEQPGKIEESDEDEGNEL